MYQYFRTRGLRRVRALATSVFAKVISMASFTSFSSLLPSNQIEEAMKTSLVRRDNLAFDQRCQHDLLRASGGGIII